MKKRLAKQLKKLVAIGMTAVFVLGCGATEESAKEVVNEQVEEKGEAVHLKIHTLVTEQPDQEMVIEALNEYTKEKINITADWVFHGGAYSDKMQVIISSGEEYDACFTSNWLNLYNDNVAKGAFVNIKDMLPEVAPDLYELLPEYFWTAATINEGIYAVPNQQIVARQQSVEVPKDYLDASGMKLEDLTNLTNITEFAQIIYDQFGAKVGPPTMSESADYTGYEFINGYTSAGAIKMGDNKAKVVNYFETDEWLSMLKENVALNEKGLLDGETAYNLDYFYSQRAAKKMSVWFTGTYKPGVEAEASAVNGYETPTGKVDIEPYISTGSVIATMFGISSTSKHPEETLKYLELINTDPYVMNLLSYGIEEVHYNKVSDNVIELVDGSGYAHGYSWAFGNVFNTYALSSQPEDVWEQTKALNESAVTSPLLGFSFNSEPVKMQIANVSTVIKEYESILGGDLPVNETNAEFVEKLKVAGVDEIIVEMQKQVDEFMASK